jgi:hypothetical protein
VTPFQRFWEVSTFGFSVPNLRAFSVLIGTNAIGFFATWAGTHEELITSSKILDLLRPELWLART